ncbi:hypothetical protein E2C01_031076 [Portunus trituberculatus]|uniref:Uncharacterized protein n=1 Tax=Portunus trituberculatus TaxID=210409 RepID=A0A5B7EX50_PORTR|nr:hypothetical protein [Portunus trituberculatus]
MPSLGDNSAFCPSLVSAAPREHSGLAHFARKSHSLCRANYATCSCVTGEHFRPRAAQGSRSNMPTTDASNSSRERLLIHCGMSERGIECAVLAFPGGRLQAQARRCFAVRAAHTRSITAGLSSEKTD